MPAVKIHHTTVDSGTWDGGAQVKKLRAPISSKVGDDMFGWVDGKADPKLKGSWKFPHHFVSAAGLPGAASSLACSTAIAVLNGGRNAPDIPDSDRKGVWEHVAAHLEDAGVKPADVPKLRSHRPPAVAARGEMRNVPEQRVSSRSEFELREVPNGTGGTNLRFVGFACATAAEYEMQDAIGPWIESVSRGAFAKTLANGADVCFLLNHAGMTLARTKPGTLKLSEVTEGSGSPVYGVTGLHSEAMLDPSNPMVTAMRSAVERGDLDEMSFGFRVTRQRWSEDYDRRLIQQVDMDKGDVSLVNYGANPTTGGTVSLRQRFRFGPRAGRAADDAYECNRCNGLGSIHLNGTDITCPQCGGDGSGKHNATEDDELKAYALRARLKLERLRYPPGLAAPRSPRARLEALRRPPWS